MFRYSPTIPRELKPVSLERAAYLEQVTERLAADLGDSSYMLAGALGIGYLLKVYEKELPRILVDKREELRTMGITNWESFLKEIIPPRITQINNCFYRDIRSVRLLCLEDALEGIVRNGEQNGLKLCHRKRMVGGIEQYGEPITSKEAVSLTTEFLTSDHLRLIRLENGAVPNHLKTEIGRYYDIFLHHYQDASGSRVKMAGAGFIDEKRGTKVEPDEVFVVSNKHRFSVPLKYFYNLSYTLANGRSMPIANPVYIYVSTKKHFEKTKGRDEVDEVDLEVLNNLLKFATERSGEDLLCFRQ
ncbi:MAG: hypothetical protein AABX07_00655 [Nanoarchaeota archaeon]